MGARLLIEAGEDIVLGPVLGHVEVRGGRVACAPASDGVDLVGPDRGRRHLILNVGDPLGWAYGLAAAGIAASARSGADRDDALAIFEDDENTTFSKSAPSVFMALNSPTLLCMIPSVLTN